MNRPCAQCDWSLRVLGYSTEDGVVVYCCEPRAQIGLTTKRANGTHETVPELAASVREHQDLCGPQGVWFKASEHITGATREAESNEQTAVVSPAPRRPKYIQRRPAPYSTK